MVSFENSSLRMRSNILYPRVEKGFFEMLHSPRKPYLVRLLRILLL